MTPRAASPRASAGFTLIELLIAVTLMALLSAILFGSLHVAGRSWDAGDARAESNASMRMAGQFLHDQLEAQHPQRMKKIVEFPLLFAGAGDSVQYAAAVPSRILGGGVWYYRVRVAQNGERSVLVLDRMIPDVTAQALPDFGAAETTVLADDIKAVKFQYYGRDAGADASVAPTWRDAWDDRQTLPLAIRIDVTPAHGAPWPTIVAAPRTAPESGCRTYDAVRQRCVAA